MIQRLKDQVIVDFRLTILDLKIQRLSDWVIADWRSGDKNGGHKQ
ncbi:hypothetical protein [uncultured Sanguibacteroides sp.]|nr:hypothetical protein [uncultured Sanguibacteroides sp.]